MDPRDDEEWLDWQMWWRIIVHDNDPNVHEPLTLFYGERDWSEDPDDPPFPFNLEETWYCAAILAALLVVHTELDTTWLLSHGYIHYFSRIMFKALLTIAISFGSTLLLEVIANVIEMVRETVIMNVWHFAYGWCEEHIGWPPLDVDAPAWGDGELKPYEFLIRFVMNTLTLALNYIYTVLMYLLPVTMGGILVWLASLVSTDLSSFLYNIETYFELPTPPIDGTIHLETFLWEYGPPICLQLWAAALIYMFVFVFVARSHIPVLRNEAVPDMPQDGFSKLAYNLLRATSIHLLSYTAYQVLCIVLAVTPSPPLFNVLQQAPRSPVLQILSRLSEFHPQISLYTVATNAVVRTIGKLLIQFLFPFWTPHIAWLSLYTEKGAQDLWERTFSGLMYTDMDIQGNGFGRLYFKSLMAGWFGMKSSWPMRMNLGDELA
ncbi:hypothetical protein F5B19DRAFT_480081 [Rostrohypoxylon terebratum]|nr:hypothetical protein F5B19DRAFT_480081 [Rostrohypoxylon terebratum]